MDIWIANPQSCKECDGFGVQGVWRDKERILWRWCTCAKSIKLQTSYDTENDKKEFFEFLGYLADKQCKKQ